MRTEDSREIGRTDGRTESKGGESRTKPEDLLGRMAEGFGARRDKIRLYWAIRTNEANVRQTVVADGQTFDEEKDAFRLADGRLYDEGYFWSSPKIRAQN